jgi:septum formation protein
MARPTTYRLILASSSPARRYLLERAGYDFIVVPSNVDESCPGAPDARSLVQALAWRKAAAVADRLALVTPTIIVAADSVGWLDGEVIGKPDDRDHARRILRQLGGRDHELWTGTCLWLTPPNRQIAWQEVSRVYLDTLDATDLEAYLDTNAWVGCSGAYAVAADGNDPLVHVQQGSLTNVMGLPMETLAPLLDQLDQSEQAFLFHHDD